MSAPAQSATRSRYSDDFARQAADLRMQRLSYDEIAERLNLEHRRHAESAVTAAVLRGFVRRDQLPAPHTTSGRRKRPEHDPAPEYVAPKAGPVGWQRFAACREEDPELFFAPGAWSTHEAAEQAREAKAVCRRCPVRSTCLADALASGDDFAIRGATTPAERRVLRQNGSAA